MQADARIIGTVTDFTTSLPISGALVEAIRGNTVRYSDTTGVNGTYTLSNIQPSNYTLVFSAPGYQTRAIGVNPRNNQTTVVDISLVPIGGAISGTVTNAITSTPIPGATVYIFQNSTLMATQITNGSGIYTVNNLAPGTYIVLVLATGFQGEVEAARVSVGMTTITDFALQPDPGTISGQVTDALTSAPIQDAQIEVFKDSILVGFANSDSNGNYTIPDLAPGNYIVVASSTNYNSQAVGAAVTSNNTTTLNFALTKPPGTIAGRVIDGNTSNPIPGATISIFQDEVFLMSTLTDINGFYEISELAPGDYTVVAQANNYQIAVDEASVSASNTTIVNFSLNPNPGSISGTISDGMNGIAGAQILVFSGSQLITSGTSDMNGEYTIPNLAPGTYLVLVRATGFRAAFSSENVMSGVTTTANFTLSPNAVTVTGQITNLCDGSPIPGALVVVTDGSTVVGFTLTDTNGNYTIDGLAPGNYTVTAAKQNFFANSATASIPATVNLSLTPRALPPASIQGEVIKNRFLTQTDRIHSISWTASPGLCVTGYQIFRNGILIAFVPASAPLTYMDHNRKTEDVYTVKAINSLGEVSSAVSIVLF